jgi:hypothetical protein
MKALGNDVYSSKQNCHCDPDFQESRQIALQDNRLFPPKMAVFQPFTDQ